MATFKSDLTVHAARLRDMAENSVIVTPAGAHIVWPECTADAMPGITDCRSFCSACDWKERRIECALSRSAKLEAL